MRDYSKLNKIWKKDLPQDYRDFYLCLMQLFLSLFCLELILSKIIYLFYIINQIFF